MTYIIAYVKTQKNKIQGRTLRIQNTTQQDIAQHNGVHVFSEFLNSTITEKEFTRCPIVWIFLQAAWRHIYHQTVRLCYVSSV